MSNIKSLFSCNFCGKNNTQVKKLISQNSTYICNECVMLCVEAIKPQEDVIPQTETEKLTPEMIVAHLDQYVIGQAEAKKTISVAIRNHIKRIQYPVIDGVTLDKSNQILVGGSGTGKTHMVKTLARILNVPFAIVDATSISQTGYVGLDPEECLIRLFQAADNDMAAAEKGIVFIDEIDKIARKGENASTTRDVSGEGVQQALLKIIEGSEVKFSPSGGRKNPNGEFVTMNTKDVLFIVGGAFDGLDKIIQRRIGTKANSMGFGGAINDPEAPNPQIMREMQTEDLIAFGMIPEFVGRIPVALTLDNLDAETLRRILTEPKNSIIRQFEKLFEIDGVKLEFEEAALKAVANQVLTTRTGARGLRSVVEACLRDSQYELPNLKSQGVSKIVVSEDNILNHTPPTKHLTPNETSDTINP